MSSVYTATAFYGLLIPRSDLVIQKPNPLFGVCNYDPKTGDKVYKYINEKIKIEPLADAYNLNIAYLEDFKVLGCAVVSANENNQIMSFDGITEDCKNRTRDNIHKVCNEVGITFAPSDIRLYILQIVT